ncbi:PEP-CTERM sorting domain-containing protein [Aquabacterium sp. CECT 9606]|uniref:PEP-CTERM sorting domain-containing protein n=1 Tax=Aquabacterium sp. CECT 9606 TaxID=2845822 RepID=UPI001E626676|nr:PEP-CTERM sorting domain-containing protein [Aquabacterium sp. CECT 9606]CAH0354794.1 hypothetical protein AQB9606_03944 [Aquabacterium sp. CECT 9606]
MAKLITASIATALSFGSFTASAQLTKLEAFAAPGGVSQLAYSSNANKLVVRNSASAIKVIDLTSHNIVSTEMANARFTDMSLSPGGLVLYAADYAGEHIGYSEPLGQHYVHRLDLATNTWATQTTNGVAGRIETVDDQRFILQSTDQWINFGVKQWGSGGAIDNVGNTVSWSVYSGNIQYDATHSRVIHGSSGISSPELSAFKLTGNTLTPQEGSGTYGSAYVPGAGNGALLSSNDAYVYYGALQFDPLDVHALLRTFPEQILGANSLYAFSASNYYNQETGALIGSLGGVFSAFAFSRTSNDFWAFDGSANQLVHFASSVPEASTWMMLSMGLVGLGWATRRRNC